jgi:hypothetical protein
MRGSSFFSSSRTCPSIPDDEALYTRIVTGK